MTSATTNAAAPSPALIRKLNWRLLPFLLICYIFATIDRVNVGFAKLQMQSELGLSDAAFGLGAGIFFIGYMMFEVPSNLMFPKWGARKTFSRILMLWGLTSGAMAFVPNEMTFYVLRFLLGVFEAGFAPGMIFYLTYWYGKQNMGSVLGIVLLAGPLAGIIAGPLSGAILAYTAGIGGLHGWQWMFLLESLPCLLFGLMAPLILVDKPAQASWLNAEEKRVLASQHQEPAKGHGSFAQVAKDPTIYKMALVLFCLLNLAYAVAFWLPSMIKSAGVSDPVTIGLLTAIPSLASVVAMVLSGRFSDRSGNRAGHVACYALLSAIALTGATVFDTRLALSLTFITAAVGLMFAAYTVIWAIPSEYLKGDSAAGGIALINTLALLSGFVAPNVFGLSATHTGSTKAGMAVMVILMFIGAVTAFLLHRQFSKAATAKAQSGAVPAGRI